jgi:hypothetical protein
VGLIEFTSISFDWRILNYRWILYSTEKETFEFREDRLRAEMYMLARNIQYLLLSSLEEREKNSFYDYSVKGLEESV